VPERAATGGPVASRSLTPQQPAPSGSDAVAGDPGHEGPTPLAQADSGGATVHGELQPDRRHAAVFLLGVDNTPLDNDRIRDDIRNHLARRYGPAARDRDWAIREQLFVELGDRDCLGALRRYRVESPTDVELIAMSSCLVDCPFADALYPGAIAVLRRSRLREWGTTVNLSDGDVVFQPRKIERSGIAAAVGDRVLVYIHTAASPGRRPCRPTPASSTKSVRPATRCCAQSRATASCFVHTARCPARRFNCSEAAARRLCEKSG